MYTHTHTHVHTHKHTLKLISAQGRPTLGTEPRGGKSYKQLLQCLGPCPSPGCTVPSGPGPGLWRLHPARGCGP